MTISRAQCALLHTAKAKLGLEDDTYRSILVRCAGVTSSKELDREGFESVMAYMRFVGFDPVTPHGKSYGKRAGFASPAQVELIRELWREYTGAASFDEATLNKWLLSKWKVATLRFLTAEAAPKVITALKAMKARPRRVA